MDTYGIAEPLLFNPLSHPLRDLAVFWIIFFVIGENIHNPRHWNAHGSVFFLFRSSTLISASTSVIGQWFRYAAVDLYIHAHPPAVSAAHSCDVQLLFEGRSERT